MLGSLFVSVCLAVSAQTNPGDQKWLEAVQKMVANGEHRLSTPSEQRVNLFKNWAKEHGYTVKVAKTDGGFRLEVAKELAQK